MHLKVSKFCVYFQRLNSLFHLIFLVFLSLFYLFLALIILTFFLLLILDLVCSCISNSFGYIIGLLVWKLSFLHRHLLLQTSLTIAFSLSLMFWHVLVQCPFISITFKISLWFLHWPHCLFKRILFNFHIFAWFLKSLLPWFLVLFHCGQRRHGIYNFNF